MKYGYKKTALYFSFFLSTSISAHGAEWSYNDDKGPEQWSKLDDSFYLCQTGKNQSPVNLSQMLDSTLKPMTLNYKNAAETIVHTGHTLQMNFSKNNHLALNTNRYTLKQIHFHAPAEHQVEGASFPAEIHFVHENTENNLVVLALLVKEGQTNHILNQAWNMLPEKKGDERKFSPGIIPAEILPNSLDYFTYNGSLTTPPCTEGVRWLIVKNFIEMSKLQLDRLTQTLGEENNRPVQNINARYILQ